MEIKLRTGKFCIETAVRQIYEKLLKLYFKKKINNETRQQLESQIEGLKTFLEQADTNTLRSLYPELDAGGETDVILSVDAAGREMKLIFGDKEIISPRKSVSANSMTAPSSGQ